jgi:flagellar M-ring protein FliF
MLERLISFWRSLERTQKISLIGGSILLVLLSLSFSWYLTKPEYADLYRRIDPEEAARIVTKLEEWKVPYKLVDTTIRVPLKEKDRLRVKLAGEKLAPEGGIIGWELFDKVRFAITDYERRILELRAIQGELARTIRSIEGVEDVKVLITMPKKELFIEEEEEPTASVNLRLSPYVKLEPENIKGIVMLVSRAVSGLKPENVTIVDQFGNILSEDEYFGQPNTLTARQLELQRQEAKLLERYIKKTLAKALNSDKVEVIVRYEMDFDRVEVQEEKYSFPGFEQLKLAETEKSEELSGQGEVPGGAPGVEAQMPTYKAGAIPKGPIEYKKKERKTDYLADKSVTRRLRAPAPVKISVAALVDGTYEYDAKGKLKIDEKTGLPIYHPRSKEEMRKLENIIWASIGAEEGKEYPEKEYIVKLENVQFDRTAEWRAAREERRALLLALVSKIVTGIIVLVVLLGIILFLRSLWRHYLEEERRRREERRLAEARAAEEIPGIPVEELTEEERRALQIAARSPERVAELERTLLEEKS